MKVCSLAPLALAVSCSISLLTGCSSSSSSSNETAISGSIVAAPVNGAQVSVTDVNGNVVAGPVGTNTQGVYALNIPNASLSQDLIVKSTGGTFMDEATGNDATAAEMYAYASANSVSSGSSLSATPGSTIIAKLVMNHNKTMTQAQEIFRNAFGYIPDTSVTPADAMTASTDASDAEKLSGFRAAAFSQLAMDLGLSQNDQFAMFTALAKDLSDDVLDGVDSSGIINIGTTGFNLQADIQNRFTLALINFKANTNNLSGLDNAQIGNVPFAKVALTNNYKIVYEQIGMMEAMAGKSTFKITVTNKSDDTPYAGAAPMLIPMMHMATRNHSTPKPVISVVDETGGVYTVTVYYLMPSQMADGMSMGFWDLKFTVAGEEAHFYPTVMMAMGDTLQVRLKGVSDTVMSMSGMVGRPYFIFKDSLTGGTGSYDFTVFIAARGDTMMSFPAVYQNSTLSGNNVDTITVEFSDDDGANWVTADDNGDGTFTRTGLSLLNAQEDQIRVRLTVNHNGTNEVKTTDGLIEDAGVNDYQTFTVTTGMSM